MSEDHTQEFMLPVRVYIEDTDAGGIVYYVNYLKFMERARTEFMRTLGFGKDYIFNQDLMFVVQDVSVRYVQPAELDDELLVGAAPTRIGGASIVLRQCVWRGDELLVEGEVKIACVHAGDRSPRRMPPEMLERLRSLDIQERSF